jgi:branched-chain amino acid transport system ATP-binding protein
VSIFLVEQDIFAAFSIADRAYVMETGRIVKAGKSRDLTQDPAVRSAYLGVEARQ